MEDEYICKCCLVTHQEIVDSVKIDGIKTIDELKNTTMATSGCGKCKIMCEHLIKKTLLDMSNY